MDKMNRSILKCLKANSRMSWQDIGKQVHLTGQAVSVRVQTMVDEGIISGFTVWQEQVTRHFITMFMEQSDFSGFETFLSETDGVEHAFKVTGEGCYQVIFISENGEDLEVFLNHLLRFGKYKVASAIRCVK